MKLRKDFEIAMKLLSYLKTQVNPVSSESLAKEVGTTTAFVEQIIRKVRMHGFVTVTRGPGGGYTLNPSARDSNAFEVSKAFFSLNEVIPAFPNGSVENLLVAVQTAFLNTRI